MIDKLNPLYARGVKPIPVIPTVYTDALSYGEQLGIIGQKADECVNKVNEVVEDNNTFKSELTEQQDTFETDMQEQQDTFETTMQEQYDTFLEDYQRQFGVVQELGESVTDVLSQKASTDEFGKVIYKPDNSFGENGQVLRSTGNGTEWANVAQPTDEQVNEYISAWLNAHPEATTTVQDGSLTKEKFTTQLIAESIKDYVTPQMFGVYPNTSADVTSALQTILNNENVKQVVFPKGTYIVNGLVVPSEKSIVGLYGCVFRHTDSSTDCVIANEHAYRGCTIKGIKFAGGFAGKYAISCCEPESYIADCIMDGYNGRGISLYSDTDAYGAWGTLVERCKVIGTREEATAITTTPTIGIYVNVHGGFVGIRDCVIILKTVGILLSGGGNTLIERVNIEEITATDFPNTAQTIASIRIGNANNTTIRNCTFEYVNGLFFSGTNNNTKIHDCSFNNTVKGDGMVYNIYQGNNVSTSFNMYTCTSNTTIFTIGSSINTKVVSLYDLNNSEATFTSDASKMIITTRS